MNITEHDLKQLSEAIQNDLLVLLDGLPQEAQDRACQIVVDQTNALIASGKNNL